MMHRRAFIIGAAISAVAAPALAQNTALPSGGRGGRLLRVTTLDADGPGSLLEAIRAKGPRIIVFEVGGVIDLNRTTLRIREPDLTIAGHTAPSPGVTLVRGGIEIGQDCQNIVIQHLAVRPGDAGAAKGSGWECDGIYAYGARRVRVENCSITWATDEGLSASGKRFGRDNAEATLDQWRAATSSDIHFIRNIVAEGLSNATHSKGEHSKGTLIHDNVRNAHVIDSLYAHNMERNILFKGGAQGEMRGCVVYNPGKRFAHYNLHAGEWGDYPYAAGDVTIADNVFLGGPSTTAKVAAFMLGGEGPLNLDMRRNYMRTAKGEPLNMFATFGSGGGKLTHTASDEVMDEDAAHAVIESVLAGVGSRPWDRDAIDARIVADVRKGMGRIIDSQDEVGGYPVRAPARAAFIPAQWNLDTMQRL